MTKKSKNNTPKKKEDPHKIIHEELQKLLEKHKVKISVSLDFPEYKILPADVQLAKTVISKHNHRFVINFIEDQQE